MRNIRKMIITVVTITCILLICTLGVNAETVEPENVLTYTDQNMYFALKEILKGKYNEANDTKKQLTMTNDQMNSITKLDLSSRGITNAGELWYFNNLSELNLSKNNIVNITGLVSSNGSKRPNIKVLYIDDNVNFTDIATINKLTTLNELYLANTKVTDVPNTLISLDVLSMSGTSIGTNASKISGLTNLTKLYIDNSKVPDVAFLNSCKSITELNIQKNSISNIDAIKNLTSLIKLYAGENKISDVSPLADITTLKELELQRNQIKDVKSLSNLTSLTSLNLSENQLESVEGILNLTVFSRADIGTQKIGYIIEDPIKKNDTAKIPSEYIKQIIKDSKTKGNKLYTSTDPEEVNCKLSSDGTEIELDTSKVGDIEATITIKGGKIDGTIVTIQYTVTDGSTTTNTTTNNTSTNDTESNTSANATVNNTVVNNTTRNNTVVNNTTRNNTAANNTARNNTVANNTARNNTVANNTMRNNTTVNNTTRNNTTANNTTKNNIIEDNNNNNTSGGTTDNNNIKYDDDGNTVIGKLPDAGGSNDQYSKIICVVLIASAIISGIGLYKYKEIR